MKIKRKEWRKNMKDITESISYIGVDDKTIDLFESQYVVPNGVSYNSYIIHDEKTTVMDTVDKKSYRRMAKNVEEDLKMKDHII